MNKNADVKNIIFCGIGGQGVLTASEICALALMYEGYHVKKSEVKGMAQRGGSVQSFVRFGSRVYSPLISRGKADFLVGFDENESRLWSVYLASKGIDLTKALIYGGREISSQRFLNTFILGCLSAYLNVNEENWFKSMAFVLKNKALDENKAVFMSGRNFVKGDNV